MTDWCWLLPVLLSLLWCIATRQRRQRLSRSAPAPATRERLLKPRPPDDCPECRRPAACPLPPPQRQPVRPWREVKSRRGAPKRIATDGFACLTPTCPYYRITDAHIHALVGDGTHGKTERIQTLRCQACNATFTTRRHTPLYRVKTASQRIGLVLTALAKG